MTPFVSVIIPVYNVEKYLRECLNSVLAQTLENIEIICINDGSPDNSLAILREYEQKDARIKVIDKQNEGVGKARNDGMKAAIGEFIAFMDSDDYYPDIHALESLYETAKRNHVNAACGTLLYLEPDGSVDAEPSELNKYGMLFHQTEKTAYRDYQYDYGYTKFIFSRQMIVENGIQFPPLKRFQDPVFFVQAMTAVGSFASTDTAVYCYRRLRTDTKYSVANTIDFLAGLRLNLAFSRSHGLAKLHYLTAMRLDKDGSFMATQNLFDERRNELISAIIKAVNAVDVEWLRENGYDIPADFVPEVFTYAVSAAEKYEKARNNKFSKVIKTVLRHRS